MWHGKVVVLGYKAGTYPWFSMPADNWSRKKLDSFSSGARPNALIIQYNAKYSVFLCVWVKPYVGLAVPKWDLRVFHLIAWRAMLTKKFISCPWSYLKIQCLNIWELSDLERLADNHQLLTFINTWSDVDAVNILTFWLYFPNNDLLELPIQVM